MKGDDEKRYILIYRISYVLVLLNAIVFRLYSPAFDLLASDLRNIIIFVAINSILIVIVLFSFVTLRRISGRWYWY